MSSAIATAFTAPQRRHEDFEAWWSLPGEYVEAPNQRRGGWSGVVRAHWRDRPCYIKRQHNHLFRSAVHPFGWPTASREHFYLQRVRALGIAVPEVIYHGIRRSAGEIDAVLATHALAGFAPLADQHDLDATTRLYLARSLGSLLGTLHRARLQHGCLYDKHIMVRWRDDGTDLALLDLEKMRYRLTRRHAAARDLSQLRRHQQLWRSAEWRALEDSHALTLAA